MPLEVIVVGAGPVGCLAALGLAQRGCKVQVFDSRRDPRPATVQKSSQELALEQKRKAEELAQAGPSSSSSAGNLPAGAISSDPQLTNPAATAPAAHRSINLAISTRGLTGLQSVRAWHGPKGKGRDLEYDLADIILSEAVPMRARMIHTKPHAPGSGSGDAPLDPSALGISLLSQAYSTVGESINSVDRARLNNLLLDQAVRHPNITVAFEYKLLRADLEHALPQDEAGSARMVELLFESTATRPPRGASVSAAFGSRGQTVLKECDLVIGCDGHHSKLRSEMFRFVPRMDFSQAYIDSGYVELSIPRRSEHPNESVRNSTPRYERTAVTRGELPRAPEDDEFLLDPNHLHIWPRHDFMLIALPNRDGSFTCTLFAPFNVFRRHLSPKSLYGDDGSVLQDDERVDRAEVGPDDMLAFFQEHFPDALPLIEPRALVRDLSARKPSNLGMISVDPYTYKERAILLGDAAHAMVPFYGQGLNCGLEDVRVMLEHIDAHLAAEGALAVPRPDAEGDAAPAPSLQSALLAPPPAALSRATSTESYATATSSGETPESASASSPVRESTATTPPTEPEAGADAETSARSSKPVDLSTAAAKALSAVPDAQQADVLSDMPSVRAALRGAFNAYSSARRADLVAISSLALSNYREMSSRVVSPAYLARMKLDGALMRTLPAGWWKSLYSMVTFSNTRYSDVVRQRDWQNAVVKNAVEVAAAIAAVGVAAGSWVGGRWLLHRSRA